MTRVCRIAGALGTFAETPRYCKRLRELGAVPILINVCETSTSHKLLFQALHALR
jgi:hypothetical protein